MTRPGAELPDFPASQLFLRRLAYSLVRDEARAEDLVQDTWAAWVEHRPSGIAEPRAWLARVLRNRAFNQKREDERRARREALAGRPDPSAPETDGTLEAQAQLIEALRALEEPYRSTLVQRYYHDLGPAEISERSGTPLDTVKARLARGLAKLRAQMDRRYRGDRKAWCHWLTVLGSEGVPQPGWRTSARPLAPIAGAGSAAWTALGGAGVLGKSVLFAALLVTAVAYVLWRTHRPPPEPPPVTYEVSPIRPSRGLTPPQREPVAEAAPEPAADESEPTPEVAPVPQPVPAAFPAPLPFEWPQLGGTPMHDNYTAFRGREDVVFRPRVRFTVQGAAGQPTIAGTELYSGGEMLVRVDLASGKVHPSSKEVVERVLAAHGVVEVSDPEWADWTTSQGLATGSRVAAAPALAADVVVARMVRDGSVSGFDRDLSYVRWSWEPRRPGPWPYTGCLVEGLFVATHRSEVVALSALNGRVEWRFDTGEDGDVHVVPASDGDLVYFATERGVVFALELASGKERWRRETKRAYAGVLPVAFPDRVVLIDRCELGGTPGWSYASTKAFQSYDGLELWSGTAGRGGNGKPGVGDGRVLALARDYIVCLSLDGRHVPLGPLRGSPAARGSPVWVGSTIYWLDAMDGLVAHDVESRQVRWTVPFSEPLDFVHAGDQIYVATATSLVCLADDPEKDAAPPGFVLGAPDGERPELELRRKR